LRFSVWGLGFRHSRHHSCAARLPELVGFRGGWRQRSNSLIRNSAPPQDHQRALGIVLLYGPTGARFLMSEAPLQGLGEGGGIGLLT